MRIFLNKAVEIEESRLSEDEKIYKYNNSIQKTYVMVNYETHQKIQDLCNGKIDILNNLPDWKPMVDYLYERYIIEFDEPKLPIWQKLAPLLDPKERLMTTWDLRDGTQLGDSQLAGVVARLVLENRVQLRIICDQIRDSVERVIDQSTVVMHNLILQTRERDEDILLSVVEKVDQIILVLGADKLQRENQQVIDLLEKIKWRTPKLPIVLLEDFTPELLNLLRDAGSKLPVKILLDCQMDQWMSEVDLENLIKGLVELPNLQAVYCNLEDVAFNGFELHRQVVCLDGEGEAHSCSQEIKGIDKVESKMYQRLRKKYNELRGINNGIY